MGAWQITKKDLWLLVQDRRTLFLLVALPLVFVAILGTSTGRLFATLDSAKLIKLDVFDDDHGEIAANFISQLQAVKDVLVVVVENHDEGRKRLEDGRCNLLVSVGPRFQQRVDELKLFDVFDLQNGKLAAGPESLDISIESGASLGTMAGVFRQLVFDSALSTVARPVLRRDKLAARHMETQKARRMEQEAERQAQPPAEKSPGLPTSQDLASAVAPAAGSPRPSYVYQQLVPSYTVMFAFFLVNIMAHSFISERNLGTLRRLRMAPILPVELLAGKTIPFLVISLVQSGLLFLFGRLLFGMSWGDQPWLLLPVMFCNSLAATALGLLLSTLVRTESQVSAYANFLVISTAGISGCFLPRDMLPELMQKISLATPHAWALIAYQQILTRAHPDLATIGQCCVWLAGYAAAYFALGCWRFQKLD